MEQVNVVQAVQQEPPVLPEEMDNRLEAGRRYNVHYYGGKIHRLPKDWQYPRCGMFDLWRLAYW
jgi:hypothetical protein